MKEHLVDLPLLRSQIRMDLSLHSESLERQKTPVGSSFNVVTGAVCPLKDHLQLPEKGKEIIIYDWISLFEITSYEVPYKNPGVF